jgi:predicted membrane metal-binding protein
MGGFMSLRLRTQQWALDGPPAPGSPVRLPIRILNPPITPITSLRVEIFSDYSTVEILRGTAQRRSWLTEVADIEEEKQLEWTGAQNRTSRVRLSPDVPAGTEIPLILDSESWSFSVMPDVRYGKEPLYQAFQFHKHHLFGWKWKASQSPIGHPKERSNHRCALSSL